MTISVGGSGTKFYGKKWQPDGTYITTKYIVVCWIPIAKVGELRVQPLLPRELHPTSSPARMLATLRDVVYVLAAIGLIFFGIPVIANWLHPS